MRNKVVKSALSLVLAASLVMTGVVPSATVLAETQANGQSAMAVSAGEGTADRSKMEKEHAEISKRAAEEGIVLLENKNEVLPVAKGTKAALFGTGSYATIKGGTGSGDVYNKYTITIYDGLQSVYTYSNQKWWDNYIKTFNEKKQQAASEKKSNEYVTFVKGSFGGADSFLAIDQPLSQSEIDSAKANGVDTAFYTVSRTSGEGADRAIDKGEYYLSDVERGNIELMAKNFDKTVILLNVGGIVDTKFFKEINGLDSLVLVSQAGMEGGTAMANILTGAVTPSGKLSDTWAADYKDYPASETIGDHDNNTDQEDYTEGIYVGYRYFDSFGKTPAYEFGYGKSYTKFEMKPVSVKANADTVDVTVNVKNTGNVYSGKEVVQVYFSAPDGALEKPYQELAGFAKTDVLAPGASQNLTVSYKTTEMSSYSEEKAAYIMEDGNYIIRVGNSSRNTKAAAVLTLSKDVITEQLSNQLQNDRQFKDLSAAGASAYSYAGEAAEIAAAARIALPADAFKTLNNASKIDEEAVTTYLTAEAAKDYTATANEKVETVQAAPEGTKLIDVYKGTVSMESFIAGLTNKQMANIVNGISGADTSDATDWGSESNSVQGAAGETTGNYGGTLGIPNTVEADGPAGVRVTEPADNATAFPIGTLLAQTWNLEILTEVGRAIGKEMNEFGVTLWLAPGMNIHRDPMNGRNFEYYSEDPALTGYVGSCITAGVQSNPGVGVTIKHYITNNQETNRSKVNTSVSERALREIYLKGFEMVIKSARPMAIMSSYNKVNGAYACENFDLLESIPRGEWGFDGMVMTDWVAGSRASVSGMMHSGNDLVMPGMTQQRIVDALAGTPSNDLDKDKTLVLGDVQKCVGRVLTMIMRSLQFGRMYSEVEVKAHTPAAENLITYLTSNNGSITTKADELEKKVTELEKTIDQLNKDLAAKDQQAQGAANSAKELQKQLETLQKELEKVKFTSQTMNLKKASGKKKSIAVSWKKVSGAEGYEISYSTKSSFKKAKKVTVGKKASATIKKLKSKQKYYVRVHAYKKVNGKKIYTQYSNVKTVKTK
ncbi:MAG: glycoside hydrolase [Lachnospiraceae bacterium]|nr:glycoside hydrolase [Lachnospiraceae bacterium]